MNLVLYMHLRIFAYSSNNLMANFDPMDSALQRYAESPSEGFVLILCPATGPEEILVCDVNHAFKF